MNIICLIKGCKVERITEHFMICGRCGKIYRGEELLAS